MNAALEKEALEISRAIAAVLSELPEGVKVHKLEAIRWDSLGKDTLRVELHLSNGDELTLWWDRRFRKEIA